MRRTILTLISPYCTNLPKVEIRAMGPCRNNLRSFLLLLLHCSWSRSGEVLELGSDFLRLFPAGFPDHLSPFVLLAGAWLSAAAEVFVLGILLNFWTCLFVAMFTIFSEIFATAYSPPSSLSISSSSGLFISFTFLLPSNSSSLEFTLRSVSCCS